MGRPWEPFLTAQDREHVRRIPGNPKGFGVRPALIIVDNHRRGLGDEPEPLLEAIKKWPASAGLAGWEALKKIGSLVAYVRGAGIPVIHFTGLSPEESGVTRRRTSVEGRGEGVAGAEMTPEERDRHERRFEFPAETAPVAGEAVLKKTAPSGFFGTPLESHLNALGVDSLLVVGQSTSGCVRATVVDAASYRYRVIVVEECVYDRHEASHAMSLFDMDRKYADVLKLDDVVAQLESRKVGPSGVA